MNSNESTGEEVGRPSPPSTMSLGLFIPRFRIETFRSESKSEWDLQRCQLLPDESTGEEVGVWGPVPDHVVGVVDHPA